MGKVCKLAHFWLRMALEIDQSSQISLSKGDSCYGLYSVGFGRWLLGWDVTRALGVPSVSMVTCLPPAWKIGHKIKKPPIMTSVAHGGPFFQDDNSATTRPQKSIRHAIESLEPPLSRLCVEIAVSNAHRGRISKVSQLLQICCTYTSSRNKM